jgi:subtilisin family serine protease
MKKSFLIILFLFSVSLLISQTTQIQTKSIILKIKGFISLPEGFDSEKTRTGIDELDFFITTNQVIHIKHLISGKNKPLLLFRLEFSSNVDINKMIEEIKLLRCIEIAELDHITGITGTLSITPNDAQFIKQWGLYNNGTFSYSPATSGADIDMKNAWTITQGDTNVIVGIIDSGTKLDHPEFSGRLWVNSQEIPNNGIDDDGNGYIDDKNGWNFVSSSNNPTDDNGHGTNVAGIIGANGNNGIGYAGVDWNCKIMTLKVLGYNNQGWDSDVITSVYYAVDNGARVVNMSLASNTFSMLYQEAIDYAVNNNVLVITAMGNDNTFYKRYPAAYNGVIAVGATSPNDTRANPFQWGGGSNYGDHISVCAPGNYIFGLHYSLNTNYNYYYSGTSQAAPHVAGLASLLLAQDPTRTVEDIKMIIESTADDGVGLTLEDKKFWDPYYGFGRINAYQALSVIPTNKTLNLSVSGVGSLNLPLGTHTFEYGTLVTLEVIPNNEYYLQKWIIDGVDYVNPSNELKFRMNKNYSFQAVFSLRPIKYVTEYGAGLKNGSSWSNAYGNAEFQNGINTSQLGTIFWVAQGTYKPTEILPIAGTENRGKSFIIRNNIIIYGGFNGTESLLSQRDYINNITVFSGDIEIQNNSSDNSYHVIWFENKNRSTFVDGITIKNGNANGVYNECDRGGGVFSGIIYNCIIEYNSASYYGAGAYQSELINCIVRNNNANYGGGLYQGTAFKSYFTYNTGGNYGGAIYESIADSCDITNNSAVVYGGGAYNSTITNSIFNNNNANGGGGAYLGSISNTIFEGDSANYGGATYEVTLENCTLINNKAINYGGATFLGTLNNCHLEDNVCDGRGGAVYNVNASNCTFLNNLSYSYGGAGYISVFKNCSFVGNRGSWGGAITDSEADSCSFTANVAQFNGGGAYLSNISNCSFVNDTASTGGATYECNLINCSLTGNFASNKSGGMHLGDASNCIFENNTSVSEGGGAASEINADNCIFNNNITFAGGGALQSSTANNCTFNYNSAGSGGAMFNCEAVKCFIQNNSAINGGGTYYGNYDSCFYISNIAFSNGQGGGAYNGIISNSLFFSDSAYMGGAAYSAELFNCILVNNKAQQNGGAINYCTVKNNLIYNNIAHNNGGAAYNSRILNSTIVENKAQNTGGGTYNSNLINCMVWGNKKLNGTYDQKWGGADTNCAIQSLTIPPGPNNIALSALNQGTQAGVNYPVFLDPSSGNFRIQPTSAGFNTGNNSYVQSLYTDNNGIIIITSQLDLDSNARVIGSQIDLGAYETSSTILSILPSLNGTTNPIPGSYNYNNTYTTVVNAIPNTGYHFEKWLVNGADSLNSAINLYMNTDYTVQALFHINQYDFILTKTGNGSVNHAYGTTLYNYNSAINLIATPDTNSCFVKWICNGIDSLNSSISITVDTTYQIEAIFSNQAELDLTISGNGSINHVSGITQYSVGSVIELIATPDAHHNFLKWIVNGIDYLNDTLNLVMNNYYTVVSVFEPVKYELSLSIVGNGQVNHQVGTTLYDYGSQVSFTAIANTGYSFEKWIVNGIDSLNPTIHIIIDTNYIVEADFDTLQYNLTLSVTGNGNVNNSLGTTSYHYGTIIQLTATPNENYHFDKWEINGVNNYSNPIQITIQDNMSVQATFLYNTSVDEVINNTIKVFPNPVSNILSINSSKNNLLKIEIFNELGQLIYYDLCHNAISYSVYTAEFSNGIYFLRIFINNFEVYNTKFLKY